MPIQPQGSYITVSYNSTNSILFCESLTETVDSEPIVRPEFQHDKQRSALENTGVKPIIVDMLGGEPLQIVYGNNATLRNLLPDDTDLTNIFQKFFLTRYIFTGIESSHTDIQNMIINFAHFRSLRDKFEAHKLYAGSNVSIQYILNTLTPDNFTYYTTTGLTVGGSSIGTLNNLFLNNFTAELTRDTPYPSPKKFWKWTAEFYAVTLSSLETTV